MSTRLEMKNSMDLRPYGQKSIMECITRATLLSQPADIPDFLRQYLLQLIEYRSSHPDADLKVVSFNYQKQWERNFLKNRSTTTTATSAASLPNQTEMAQRQSEKNGTDEKKSLKKVKMPSATPMYPAPTPPRWAGRHVGKNVPKLSKGEGKPAPRPLNVSMKTRRVSSGGAPGQHQRQESTGHVKKTPECTPTQSPARPSAATKASETSKHSGIPPPADVLLLLPQKQTRGSQVPEVQLEKRTDRSQGKPKATRAQRPESAEGQSELRAKKTSAGRRKPKARDSEKTGGSQERPRKRVLWVERERVRAKARQASVAEDAYLPSVGLLNHTCPHLAHSVHIIRYRRMQVRASNLSPSHPSRDRYHHYL